MRMSVVERDLDGEKLDFLKAVGINHLCHISRDDKRDLGFDRVGYWEVDEVRRLRKEIESHGIQLDMMTLPLNAPPVERSPLPNIILATPERDAEIERLIKCIRAAAEAGVPIVVSTDAHEVAALGWAEIGVAQARRAWLTKEQVLNTRPWRAVQRMLKKP